MSFAPSNNSASINNGTAIARSSGTTAVASLPEAMEQHMALIRRQMDEGAAAFAHMPMPMMDMNMNMMSGNMMAPMSANFDAMRDDIYRQMEACRGRMEEAQAQMLQRRSSSSANSHDAANASGADAHFFSSESRMVTDGEGNAVRHTIINNDGDVEERTETINNGQRYLE